jgi:hypothetical protein
MGDRLGEVGWADVRARLVEQARSDVLGRLDAVWHLRERVIGVAGEPAVAPGRRSLPSPPSPRSSGRPGGCAG